MIAASRILLIVLLALALLTPASLWTAENHAHLDQGDHWWFATPGCPWHPDFSPDHGGLSPAPAPVHLESGSPRFCSSRAAEVTGNLPQDPLPLRFLSSLPARLILVLPAAPALRAPGSSRPLAPPGDGPLPPLRI